MNILLLTRLIVSTGLDFVVNLGNVLLSIHTCSAHLVTSERGIIELNIVTELKIIEGHRH